MNRRLSIDRAARRSGRAGPRRPVMHGFTLIELLFTVALAAILGSLAAPSLQKLIKSNRVQTEASGFVGDMMLARTEAIRRGQNVSVCVSSDGLNCLTTNTWQKGWIAFTDPSATCTGVSSVTDPAFLRRRTAFAGSDTLVSSTASMACVTFNREGFTNNLGTAQVTFTLHTSDNLTTATRCVAVDIGGRLTTQTAGQTGTSCS